MDSTSEEKDFHQMGAFDMYGQTVDLDVDEGVYGKLYGEAFVNECEMNPQNTFKGCLVKCFYNACKNGHTQIIKTLMDNGQIQSPLYMNGISFAHKNKHKDTVMYLIKTVEITNMNNLTCALDVLSELGEIEEFTRLMSIDPKKFTIPSVENKCCDKMEYRPEGLDPSIEILCCN